MSYRLWVEVELNLWQGSTRLLILVPHIKPSLLCNFIDLQYKAIYVGKKVCQVSWSLYSFKAILDHGHSKSSLTWKENENCIILWYNRISSIWYDVFLPTNSFYLNTFYFSKDQVSFIFLVKLVQCNSHVTSLSKNNNFTCNIKFCVFQHLLFCSAFFVQMDAQRYQNICLCLWTFLKYCWGFHV